MRLGEKQELFAKLVALLILKAQQLGYDVRLGELYRTKYQALENVRRGVGTWPTCHHWKIAQDLLLFRAGKYLTATEDYRELGEWWEQQHELCRWGGRFKRPDGGHFSLQHGRTA